MPGLIELYDKHAALRDRFEIIAFHDDSVKTLKEMDTRLQSIVKNVWKGKPLPFPILLDATRETHRTNFAINFYPTTILMDPEGRLIKGFAETLLERILEETGGGGRTVAVSSDGRQIALAQGTQLKVTDATGAERVLGGGGDVRVTTLAFSPDGKTVAGAGSDGLIGLWNSATGKSRSTLRGHKGPVFALAFSPDGQTLASAEFDTVRLWDVGAGQPKAHMTRHHWPSWSVAFSPDGGVVAAGGLSSVRLFDTRSGEVKATLELDKALFCRALAFSLDGKRLAASVGPEITMWDVPAQRLVARLTRRGSDVAHLEFWGDSQTLFSVNRGKRVQSWNASGEHMSPGSVQAPQGIVQMAERLPEVPEFLNDEAWAVVEGAGGSKGEYEEALRMARLAYRQTPGSTNYLQTLGAALYRSGRFEEAIEKLRGIEALPPRSTYDRSMPAAWLYLALAHHKIGDAAGAREALLRVRLGLLEYRESSKSLQDEVELELLGLGVETAQVWLESRFDRGMTAAAVLAAIDSDPALDKAVRDTARKLAAFVEAERWIGNARERIVLRTRTLKELERASGISDAARPLAEALAKRMRESPSDLNEASWNTVSQPDREKATYELALEQAEAAVRLREDPEYLNTLGVAQYRVGRYQDALTTLERSRQRNTSGPNESEDLAFLAMAHHQLGQAERARETLEQLRQNKDALRPGGQGARFLSEAEALIRGASGKSASTRD